MPSQQSEVMAQTPVVSNEVSSEIEPAIAVEDSDDSQSREPGEPNTHSAPNTSRDVNSNNKRPASEEASQRRVKKSKVGHLFKCVLCNLYR